MELKYNTTKVLVIIIIGLVASLKKKAISLSEAEHILFSPASMDSLKEQGYDQKIIDMIHLGTELENVSSIIPDKYENSLTEIENLAINYLKENNIYHYDAPKIIKKLL